MSMPTMIMLMTMVVIMFFFYYFAVNYRPANLQELLILCLLKLSFYFFILILSKTSHDNRKDEVNHEVRPKGKQDNEKDHGH